VVLIVESSRDVEFAQPWPPIQTHRHDTPKNVESSAASSLRRQPDGSAVHSLSEVKQRPGGWSTAGENQWTLRCDGALDGLVIVGDQRGHRQTERPFNLAPAVVQASAVTVDDEGYSLRVDSKRVLQQAEAGPSVPEAHHVG
jgi:hypothetical protein